MPRPGVLLQSHLQFQDVLETHRVDALAVEAGHDVARGAPQMADVLGPQPRFCVSPLAQAEDDGPACGMERVAHGLVGLRAIGRSVIAPVVLQIIDAPACVAPRILKLVAPPTRQAAARLGPGVVVHAE